MSTAAARLLESPQLAVVTFAAPAVRATSLVSQLADEVVATWASGDLEMVGLGVAHQLRGHGADRWSQIVDGVRALGCDASGARPRWFGGAAFAPGAADRAPWTGFGDAWFVLPRWTYVREGDRARLLLAVDPALAGDARWRDEHARIVAVLTTPFVSQGQPAIVELAQAAPEIWREQVTAITDAIARGACSKIVAARTCHVALAGSVRTAELLDALDDRHGDCVRIAMRPPGAGTLVAATPERLVRRTGEIVECDALAGTRNASEPAAASALLASTKDRREHQLVVDAIASALGEAGGTIDAPAEPLIKRLRHVLHLHTPFRATFAHPPHVLDLVARLHPTPAVGGTPTRLAVEWIRDREPVARGWYASPIGWFDLDGNGDFAVAIRSGVLAGPRAWLWAGAGIVAGSDPDRELAETESKLRAMLGALGAVT